MMDRCGKKYGANKTLGSELVTAVVEIHMSDFHPITMTRVAVILANLSADKVVDGISKLLVKSDVMRLTSTTCKNLTVQLDLKLNKGFTLARALYDAGHINLEEFDELVCKFFTRGILHVCNKSKLGPEGVSYKDLGEVCSAFMTDATCMVGDELVIDKTGEWTPSQNVAPVVEKGESKKGPTLLTDADQQNPHFVLESKGFKIGQTVVERGLGVSHGMYTLLEITPKDVKLVEMKTFGRAELNVRLNHELFIKNWSRYEGAVPFAVPIERSAGACVNRNIHIDTLRCKVFASIKAYELKHSENRTVQYAFLPAMVVATVKYDAGKLKLAPFTDLNKIKSDKSATASQIRVGDQMLYAYPPTRATTAAKLDDASSADLLWVPYWWVESTDSLAAANMKRVSVTDGDITYPIFQNTKVVQPFTRLLYFKAREQRQALTGAKRVKVDP
jgi:hypothetical protein